MAEKKGSHNGFRKMSKNYLKFPNKIARSSKIDAHQKAVLLYLSSLDPIRPSLRKIHQDIGISVEKVRTSIRKLEEKGVVEITQRGSGPGSYNEYRIKWNEV